MNFADISQTVISFIQQHQAWAPFIVGGLAFAESMAIISFIVPATGILLAIGALLAASGIPFWPVWAGAMIGAVLGDWLSYAVGYWLKDSIRDYWPFSRAPHFMDKAEAFTRKWGVPGVFIGRFSGPLRAFVPLAAGVFHLPHIPFQIANISSAAVWSFGILLPGEALDWFRHLQ
ncbi:DedA family protein [Camelimonas lactis]|uniref:Membrane protein DedA with SNARE-associated domain n=1 Tax=Camelimonas lactis TaxID=659006 RepID=A0A4R2GNA7_9HYPH|nr:DedA family protein [Camelimonas lactis]TCO09976.1 membrane protein DedA with SNARE-associated domain [Camelimonas lactis]